MRIAATADLHFTAQRYSALRDQLNQVRDEADLLVLAGDLTNFGQPAVKAFVRASIDEALKLERAMAQLRTQKRIVVLHYSPIMATVEGESPEIYAFLGTSRLAEVVDRHGADLVIHGHVHHGKLAGKTTGGVPVHNVAITLLQSQNPSRVYQIFDV